MAIHEAPLEDVQGFDKEIEQSAMSMALDILQRFQYAYPQKSTIRELTSNAIDAIREKDIALGILSGKLKVEDYYLKRDEDLYKDSNFDASYYNPQWLWSEENRGVKLFLDVDADERTWNKEPNKAYIIYQDGAESEKDRLIIEDFGTGLGGRRLEGYFKMMYSTKRNTKHALGKYGVGAKAGLSTAPYYVMTTRYNGREYSFNVYAHKIVSNMPNLDMATGKPNGVHVFANNAKIYYRYTNMPNGTRVEVEAKKHYKMMYIDAVKSQLLYFDNIVFQVRDLRGATTTIDVRARIIYEDDTIILSDNTQYSKPHLLINKVNYGYVDFRELELQDVQGNIGIKVEAEEVTVNPSRETVIWDEQTRATVLRSFDKVVGIAETMISKQLQADDFLEWITACAEINSRYANTDSILGRLSKIVDLSNAKIKYRVDPTVVYDPKLLKGLTVRLCKLIKVREGSTVSYKVDREHISPGQMAMGLPTIIQKGRSIFGRDKYMLTELYPNGFISFILPGAEELTDNETLSPAMRFALDHWYKDRGGKWEEKDKKDLEAYMLKIAGFVQKSRHGIEYDSIVVPDNFNISSEVIEEEQEAKTEEGQKATAARAKLMREKGIIPIFTPRAVTSSYAKPEKNGTKLFDWQKIELPVADIDTWDEEEVFYGTEKVLEFDEDGKAVIEAELLQLAAIITRPQDQLVPSWPHTSYTGVYDPTLLWPGGQYDVTIGQVDRCNHFFYNGQYKPRVKLIKVAQERRKFFLDFKPIQRFFLDIKGKTLTMSNAMVRWNTARIINKELHKLAFLENFGVFHHKHATAYANLVRYVKANYRELAEHSADERYYSLRKNGYDELIAHCDKVAQFQLFVRASGDKPEAIAAAAKELFAPEQEITDGCALDTTFFDTYIDLLDYSNSISTLLNEIGVLTFAAVSGGHKAISEELEQEIRSYLAYKNVQTQ